MTPEERNAIVLAHEGAALASVQQHRSVEAATAYIQCMIDGLVNALIRMQGAEKTSAFLFSLSDRAAGGLRQPTDFRVPASTAEPKKGGAP